MTQWIVTVYRDGELLSVGGPFAEEPEADTWVIETFPGLPDWEAIEFYERGETVMLDCGHTYVAENIIFEAAYCTRCELHAGVIELTKKG